MEQAGRAEYERLEALLVPLTLALGGGAVAAGIDAYLPLLELKPVVAGAACVGLGMVSRRCGTGYCLGLLFALSWALTLVATDRSIGWPTAVAVALLCGLLILGPIAALGALLCDGPCSEHRHLRAV